MRPNATSNNPGRTYRFYTGEVHSVGCAECWDDNPYTVP